MLNDLRFGVRMLLKNPAFTAVAVLSLALGIGANTAIFQLLNAVRMKNLPLANTHELAQIRLPPLQRLEFRGGLLERIKNVPGIEDVAEMDTLPLTGGGRGNNVWLEGKSSEEQIGCSFNRVGADYLKTLQIPLVAGRSFNAGDSRNAPRVAIINQTLARMLKDNNPVGRRLIVEATPRDPETQYEIIGVARDAKFEDLREEALPVVYLASTQDEYPSSGQRFFSAKKRIDT